MCTSGVCNDEVVAVADCTCVVEAECECARPTVVHDANQVITCRRDNSDDNIDNMQSELRVLPSLIVVILLVTFAGSAVCDSPDYLSVIISGLIVCSVNVIPSPETSRRLLCGPSSVTLRHLHCSLRRDAETEQPEDAVLLPVSSDQDHGDPVEDQSNHPAVLHCCSRTIRWYTIWSITARNEDPRLTVFTGSGACSRLLTCSLLG